MGRRCQAGKLQAKQASLAEAKAEFTAHEGLGRLTDITGTHRQKAILLFPLISMFSSACACACMQDAVVAVGRRVSCAGRSLPLSSRFARCRVRTGSTEVLRHRRATEGATGFEDKDGGVWTREVLRPCSPDRHATPLGARQRWCGCKRSSPRHQDQL